MTEEELDAMPLEELEQMASELNPSLFPIEEAFIGRTGTGELRSTDLAVEGPAGAMKQVKISYESINGVRVLEGDILLPEGGGNEAEPGTVQPFAVSIGKALRWPGGVIPYVIHKHFYENDPELVAAAKAAMRRWEKETRGTVRFVQRPAGLEGAESYIYFKRGDGCWSYLGKRGGRQDLSLGNGCDYHAALHELGHAIGLLHEHNRPERDQHIKILWENIPSRFIGEGGVQKTPEDHLQSWAQGGTKTAYDTGSLMHYGSYDHDKPWLLTRSGKFIERKAAATSKDIATVKLLYQ
jgi:astacin